MTETSGAEPFYGESQRSFQDQFDTRRLADVHEAVIVQNLIAEDQREFIQSRDFFFLSTVDIDGWPSVSYKGGPVGFAKVEDEVTIVFPMYDGNGMFLSAGNIRASGKVGLLFIDFETPNRVRVHATATVHSDETSIGQFPGASLVVRCRVENVFVNCARYIHKHQRVEDSPYVPTPEGAQLFPKWKRIDLLQDFLPSSDKGRTAVAGGTITTEEYAAHLAEGTS